ncbi:MAG TPA: molybdopterin-dependent oxidoreductase [Thermoleophilia bacterium]|nr:molybdopterin-dependent oxidoreductase [Thermoleophilia bacterium]
MGDVVRLTNSTTGGPLFVDVEDGRIVRMFPMDLAEDDRGDWVIEARGRRFTPPRRTTLSPHAQAQRSLVYSPKRILTPLKRVDFDPYGERNNQNRGVSGYEPVGWDEALDIVTGELIRCKREHGAGSILTTCSSHHLWGNIGYRHSAYYRFLNLMGMVHSAHNPDSWEGWHWGAMPMWGNSHRLGIPEQYDLLEDALKHTEMIVFWSSDPETTGGGIYSAFESTSRRYWLKELGVKMVFVDPYFNHTASLFADKWIAPRLGTDVAFGLAIAYTWLTEGTYDAEYIHARTTGFDEWRAYVLGQGKDGVAKTPAWAEAESGVPAREIRALAREWGAKKTMLAAGGLGGWGGACRSATGNEWARTMVALAAMQGYGKPGSNIWGTSQGAPSDCSFVFPGYAEGGISGDPEKTAAAYRWLYRMFPHGSGVRPTVNVHDSTEGQAIPRLRIPEAMMHERFEWRGKGFSGSSIQSQMQRYSYPAPGYPFVHMYWRYGGSFIGTMQETNRYVKAYQQGKVDFVVNQNIWFEGETRFADVILPVCTNFERWDMSEFGNCSGYIPDNHNQTSHRVIVLQKKCIEPLGESRSDYDIFAMVAERMGMGDVFTEGGLDEYDWCKRYFHATDLPRYVTWEEFERKGYFVVPMPDDYKSTPAMRWFAEGRKRDTPDWGPRPGDTIGFEGLQTPSGKIEFVSKALQHLELDVVDPERPPLGPQYIPSWEGHRTTELYGKYPLQMVSPHPRFSFHTMGDSKESWLNEVKDHRVLLDDGHYYYVMRVNARDAAARGIADRDLIRAFNDRGSVILCAQVTERLAPGTVHAYESCADYLPLGKPGESPDTAGCVNILTNKRYITPTSTAMSNNSCLVQIEKWEGTAAKLEDRAGNREEVR